MLNGIKSCSKVIGILAVVLILVYGALVFYYRGHGILAPPCFRMPHFLQALTEYKNDQFRGIPWGTKIAKAFPDYEKTFEPINPNELLFTRKNEDLNIFGAKAERILYAFPHSILYEKGHECQKTICRDDLALASVFIYFDEGQYSCKDIAERIEKEYGVTLRAEVLPGSMDEVTRRMEKEGKDLLEYADSYRREFIREEKDTAIQVRCPKYIVVKIGNPENEGSMLVNDFYLKDGYFDRESMLKKFLELKGSAYADIENAKGPDVSEAKKHEARQAWETVEHEYREMLTKASRRKFMWGSNTAVSYADQEAYLYWSMGNTLEESKQSTSDP